MITLLTLSVIDMLYIKRKHWSEREVKLGVYRSDLNVYAAYAHTGIQILIPGLNFVICCCCSSVQTLNC